MSAQFCGIIKRFLGEQMNTIDILEFDDVALLYHAAARFFIECAAAAVAKHGYFTAALSGGEGPEPIFALLAGECRNLVRWDLGHIFWVDDRDVQPDSPLSNYGRAKRLLLDNVPLPKENIHRFQTGTADAAEQYQLLLENYPHMQRNANGVPQFDVMQMGLGMDGHIASLFPGSDGILELKKLVIAVPPPTTAKPAVPRLTLTLPVINAAANLFFIVTEKEKSHLVNYILDRRNPEQYPAQMIDSEHTVHWFILR
jgi:6-phosphogluconolactonase